MRPCYIILLVILNVVDVFSWKVGRVTGSQVAGFVAGITSLPMLMNVAPAAAKTELPSLEKCFNAVRRELSPEGESLKRIDEDIDEGKWDDLKLFTREYDAGFRGGVLKSAWKQLGNEKQAGISVTNSFTFDLIALNKAARNEDTAKAKELAKMVRTDLENFLKLEEK